VALSVFKLFGSASSFFKLLVSGGEESHWETGIFLQGNFGISLGLLRSMFLNFRMFWEHFYAFWDGGNVRLPSDFPP
jgi:hypothetical protein